MLGIEAETFMNNKKFSPSAVTTLASCVSGTVEQLHLLLKSGSIKKPKLCLDEQLKSDFFIKSIIKIMSVD